MISRSLAQRFWPSGSSVGRVLEIQGGGEVVVSGVVDDHRVYSVARAHPLPYIPLGQGFLPGRLSVVFRSSLDASLAEKISREEIVLHDPNLAVFRAHGLEDRFQSLFSDRRLLTYLCAALAAAAVLLSSAGLYGTLSWSFLQRRREFAIRLAVGSGKSHVAALSLRFVFILLVVGLGIGLALVWVENEWISARLYRISILDYRALVIAVSVVFICAGALAIVSLRRALTVNPAEMLRGE